jgi:hypothetical protein
MIKQRGEVCRIGDEVALAREQAAQLFGETRVEFAFCT